MFKSRMILLALAAVAASTLFAVGSADAWWGRGGCCGGGWGAGYGAYSSGYWPRYTSYYGGYGGYGAYYGGYGGGCCGASACSSCSYAPACSSCGGGMCSSSSYWGNSSYQSYSSDYSGFYSPASYSPPVNGGCRSCMGSTTTSGAAYATVVSNTRPSVPAPAASGQVVFTITVPSDATVFVNDRPTTSTGTVRSYAAGGLLSGYQYGFTVRSERMVDGRVVSETQMLRLTTGQTSQLAFSLTPSTTKVAVQEIRPMVSMAATR